jgi:hypothetical protein
VPGVVGCVAVVAAAAGVLVGTSHSSGTCMGVEVGPEEAWGSSQGPRKCSMRPVIRTFSRHNAAKNLMQSTTLTGKPPTNKLQAN